MHNQNLFVLNNEDIHNNWSYDPGSHQQMGLILQRWRRKALLNRCSDVMGVDGVSPFSPPPTD